MIAFSFAVTSDDWETRSRLSFALTRCVRLLYSSTFRNVASILLSMLLARSRNFLPRFNISHSPICEAECVCQDWCRSWKYLSRKKTVSCTAPSCKNECVDLNMHAHPQWEFWFGIPLPWVFGASSTCFDNLLLPEWSQHFPMPAMVQDSHWSSLVDPSCFCAPINHLHISLRCNRDYRMKPSVKPRSADR